MPGNRKLVLLALADQANDSGVCFPGQKSLAVKCGLSERRLRDQLAALEEGGYIERKPRRRRDGYRTSDLYNLLISPAVSSGESPDDSSDLTGRFRQISPDAASPPLTVRKENRQGNRGSPPQNLNLRQSHPAPVRRT